MRITITGSYIVFFRACIAHSYRSGVCIVNSIGEIREEGVGLNIRTNKCKYRLGDNEIWIERFN